MCWNEGQDRKNEKYLRRTRSECAEELADALKEFLENNEDNALLDEAAGESLRIYRPDLLGARFPLACQ